jgi:hypothetical protein
MSIFKPRPSSDYYRYISVFLILVFLSACSPVSSPTATRSLTTPTVPVSSRTATRALPTPTVLPTVFTPTPSYTIYYPTPPPWDFQKRVTIQAPANYFVNNSPFEIVEYFFRQGMERSEANSVPEGKRIIAYKIEGIEILNNQYSKNFKKEHPANYIAIANIVYSVIPARYIYSDWFAGNGEYHKGDVWISGKSGYFAVVEENGQYFGIGTGSSL